LRFGVWCFALPPVIGLLALIFRLASRPQQA
jgi:hypothetical protein